MAAVALVAASGMPAACARPLTAAAPARIAADDRTKPRRDIFIVISMMVGSFVGRHGFGCRCGRRGCNGSFAAYPAAPHRHADIGVGEPEILVGPDGGLGRGNALARLGEE